MFYDTEKRQYRKLGFCIVDDAVDPDMLKPLLEAAIRAKKKGAFRRSGFVHTPLGGRRTLGNTRVVCPRNERADICRISDIRTHNEIRARFFGHAVAIGRRPHLHKSISSGLRFWLAPGFWE